MSLAVIPIQSAVAAAQLSAISVSGVQTVVAAATVGAVASRSSTNWAAIVLIVLLIISALYFVYQRRQSPRGIERSNNANPSIQ